MATTGTAAVTAIIFVSLFVGGHIGDHAVQSNMVALAKASPTDDRLAAGANPWAGWSASVYHAATTVLAQACALLIVWVAVPLTIAGTVAALMISGASHVVIDRRWLVHAIVRAKGCHGWSDGPYLVGQSLHHGAHLVAAVVAAIVTTIAGLAVTGAAALALVVSALAIERHRARTAGGRIGDPTRL